jgi:hypothetical protein
MSRASEGTLEAFPLHSSPDPERKRKRSEAHHRDSSLGTVDAHYPSKRPRDPRTQLTSRTAVSTDRRHSSAWDTNSRDDDEIAASESRDHLHAVGSAHSSASTKSPHFTPFPPSTTTRGTGSGPDILTPATTTEGSPPDKPISPAYAKHTNGLVRMDTNSPYGASAATLSRHGPSTITPATTPPEGRRSIFPDPDEVWGKKLAFDPQRDPAATMEQKKAHPKYNKFFGKVRHWPLLAHNITIPPHALISITGQ